MRSKQTTAVQDSESDGVARVVSAQFPSFRKSVCRIGNESCGFRGREKYVGIIVCSHSICRMKQIQKIRWNIHGHVGQMHRGCCCRTGGSGSGRTELASKIS